MARRAAHLRLAWPQLVTEGAAFKPFVLEQDALISSPGPVRVREGPEAVACRFTGGDRRGWRRGRQVTAARAEPRLRRQRAGGHRDRLRAAAGVPAPNVAGAAVEAARHRIAMVISAHASLEDLPVTTRQALSGKGRVSDDDVHVALTAGRSAAYFQL